ncbi:protein TESPA1 [Ambystoma mexicanum]|uniref:protein TESPA1 n=1 Tax=Ambystoma mexicanum TaxID=8296 RepID=UPI0037E7D0AC
MEKLCSASPSWEKRRAWARRTRHWHTTVDEADAAEAMQDVAELPQRCLDDVFLDGSPANKIQCWLQDCGSSVEILPEEYCPPTANGLHSHGNSFEDDLTLGAEATLFPGIYKTPARKLLNKSSCSRFGPLGNSMASSGLSSWTNKTSSSVTEILDMCQEDAETILYNLGFTGEQPQESTKIPARFFRTPSQMKGIDFRVFLEAQVRRLEMEDPCLTLANRFRQVQTLTTTANAFYCLYSYVSKTPVQKIAPSYSFVDYGVIPDIMITAERQEPLSPVDRLKRAVSRMCLYSPSKNSGPSHKDNQEIPKKLNSLGMVAQQVLEMVREDRQKNEKRDIQPSDKQTQAALCRESGGRTPAIRPRGRLETSVKNFHVSEGGVQSFRPTTQLQDIGRLKQSILQKVETAEDRSPPHGPVKRLKCKHKLHFFPAGFPHGTEQEWDTGDFGACPDLASPGPVKIESEIEAAPEGSETGPLIVCGTQEHQKKDLVANYEANAPSHGVYLSRDSESSNTYHDGICEGDSCNYSSSPSSVSAFFEARPADSPTRTKEHSFREGNKKAPDLDRSNSRCSRSTHETVHRSHLEEDLQRLHSASRTAAYCRNGFTSLRGPESEGEIHQAHPGSLEPFIARDNANLQHRMDCTAPVDYASYSENACKSMASDRSFLARMTYLQDNSFEMEEVQSNDDNQSSIVENVLQNTSSSTLPGWRCRRKLFNLHADSTQSDSSGFMDDQVLECTSALHHLQSVSALGGRL